MNDQVTPPDSDDWDALSYRPIPFGRFQEELLRLYEPPLRAKATHREMRAALKLLGRSLGEGATTASLTPAALARFIQGREAEAGANTTIKELALIRSAAKYAKAQGYMRATPFEWRSKWLRPVPRKPGKFHPIEDIRRVLDLLAREVESAEAWDRWRARRLLAVASTFAYTGLRMGEGLNLKASDVDLDAGMLAVMPNGPSGRLKTERSVQPVPIPDGLAVVLAEWMDHRLDEPDGSPARAVECPWLFPGVRRTGPWLNARNGCGPLDALKAAGERAAVEGLTFQSLRHSWATAAEGWGLGPAMIQRILRHSTLTTQTHYRHADAANMKAAVGSIDFGPASDGSGVVS